MKHQSRNGMKKSIRIFFTDFWRGFNESTNPFTAILSREYDVQITSDSPDFLFHSCHGYEHLKYDCIKICILSENLSPDFNISDYACGCDNITFDDRYFMMHPVRYDISSDMPIRHDRQFFISEAEAKTRFCNYIYSNATNSSPLREQFFDLLSAYKAVDSGGSSRNNIGFIVADKFAWQRHYKFSIAFENSSKIGYTTEKIYHALLTHTIPIYWGDPAISQIFNPERFVNCHDFASLDEVVARVRELDADQDRYAEMLSRPWFSGTAPPPPEHDPEFAAFILGIAARGSQQARRTTRHGAASFHYANQVFLGRMRPYRSAFQTVKSAWRRLGRMLSGRE